MKLTRNKIRKMILQEMDFAGGTGLDPETVTTIINALKLLLAAGTIGALHIGLLLEPLIRIHAMEKGKEGKDIDFEAAKDQVMNDPRVNDLVQNVEPGMGVDPSTIDAGPYGDFTDGDGDYPYEYQGEKVPGDDYEMGSEPDPSDYDVDMEKYLTDPHETLDLDSLGMGKYMDDVADYEGGPSQSDRLDEARKLRRRRLRRRR